MRTDMNVASQDVLQSSEMPTAKEIDSMTAPHLRDFRCSNLCPPSLSWFAYLCCSTRIIELCTMLALLNSLA